MKKNWEMPKTMVQKFEPNEYVAACVTGIIQCAYPGNGRSNGRTDRFDDYNGQESGWFRAPDGLDHGICGYDAQISFNDDTASGYEAINGITQYNRQIFNVQGYELKEGTYYGVTWNSQIRGDQSVYSHVGRLTITNIDDDHPNHS